jgi:hypothetical protein
MRPNSTGSANWATASSTLAKGQQHAQTRLRSQLLQDAGHKA